MPDIIEFRKNITSRTTVDSNAEITFTKDGSYKEIDISDQLISTSDVKAVIIASQEYGNAGQIVGAREIGVDTIPVISSNNLNYNTWCVPVTYDGEARNIRLSADASSSTNFAVAGQFNKGFIKDPDVTSVSFTNASWITNTVNVQGSDSGKIEAVVLQVYTNGTNTFQDIGFRRPDRSGWRTNDSTDGFIPWIQDNMGVVIVGVDENDQFQAYKDTPAKSTQVTAWQIGYVLKGYGFIVTDPFTDYVNPTAGNFSWVTDNWTSTSIPTTATKIIAQFFFDDNTAGTLPWKNVGIRDKTTQTGFLGTNLFSKPLFAGMEVDSDLEFETFKGDEAAGDDVIVWAEAYFDPNEVIPRGGNKLRDFSNFNQYRYV